jgi:hypothetical protein
VIEHDDSLIAADRKDLWAAVHRAEMTATLAYEHLPPSAEPLLWVADAAVWCWAHNGAWRSPYRADRDSRQSRLNPKQNAKPGPATARRPAGFTPRRYRTAYNPP